MEVPRSWIKFDLTNPFDVLHLRLALENHVEMALSLRDHAEKLAAISEGLPYEQIWCDDNMEDEVPPECSEEYSINW